MVEGQRVGARRDPAQRVEVGMRADHDVGSDLRGGIVGSASTRRLWPNAIADWWVIRASWPPPTMATTGAARGGGTRHGNIVSWPYESGFRR